MGRLSRLICAGIFAIATVWAVATDGRADIRPEMPFFEKHGSWDDDAPSSQRSTGKPTRKKVSYKGGEKPGTIIIDTTERTLHLVLQNGNALRYDVGVGRQGFEWKGSERVSRKAEWPDWRPPASMRKRQPYLPAFMPGGPNNPMGARAIYLGSTLYRIHGTTEEWSIGQAMSSGCIRMLNDDVEDLYERVKLGAKVIVS